MTVEVVSDGDGLVWHAGAVLLVEACDRLGLTRELSRGLAGMRERRSKHDPGRVVRDLAAMLADGGTAWPTCARCATSGRCSARWLRTRPPFG